MYGKQKSDHSMMNQPNKTALICVADLHINSTLAVCPPVVSLDDGGTYHASRTQRWLYECFLDFTDQAKALTEGYRNIVVFNGDLSELDTAKRSVQLISLNKATILSLVQETIAPLVDVTNECIFIRGTAAHTGKSSWSEEDTGRDTIGTIPSGTFKRKYKVKGKTMEKIDKIYSWWHHRSVVSGVQVDIAHHANMGKKPWTRRNAANNLAAEIMYLYQVDMGVRAPDLALRSHNHTYATSGDNYKCQVDYLPSWTTLTEYGYRIGYENVVSDIGGMVYLFENGTIDRHKIMYPPKDAKRIWKLKI
jgi:hypothetical protein